MVLSLAARAAFVAIAYQYVQRGIEGHPWLFVEQDTTAYMIRAVDFVQGRGFMATPPETRRTPLYPVILAGALRLTGQQGMDLATLRPENAGAWAIFRSPLLWPMVLLHHALGMLTTLLVYLIGLRLSQSIRASWLAALALDTSPVRLATDTVMLPYVVMGACLALCVWLYLRARDHQRIGWLAASGLCLGLATLAQPLPLFLWIGCLGLIIGFWAGRAPRLAAALVFAVTATALPTAWQIHNGLRSGVYQYSVHGLTSLFQFKVPIAIAERDRIGFGEAEARLQTAADERVARIERQRGRALNSFELEREWGAVALDYIRRDPVSYAAAMARSVPRLLFDQAGRRTGVYDRALMAGLLALSVLAIIRFARLGEWHHLLMLVGLAGYFIALTVPVLPGYIRFKAVVMPYLGILAAVGLAQLGAWRSSHRQVAG